MNGNGGMSSGAPWRPTLAQFYVCAVMIIAVACSESSTNSRESSSGGTSGFGGSGAVGAFSSGGSGTSGAFGSGGGPGSGGSNASSSGATGVSGAFGSGGSVVGGAFSTGGSEAGGAFSTGGSSSGSGGNSSYGAAGAGAASSAGTSGSSGTNRSAGCGKMSALTFGAVPNEDANAAPGSGKGVGHGDGGWLTIQSGGQARGFALRLPDGYDRNHPYWLIFGFHWNGGTADQVDSGGNNGYWWSYFGLQRKSNNGAIFVAPQGIGNGWANTGGRDLTFTDDMVKLIEDNYCVDTTHIITSGFSYGGGMSHEIACARAKVFHAAVIYEGAQLSGCDGGNDPIALWQMVGLTDNVCGMNLATPIRDRFVKNNGCAVQSPPQPPQPPPYLSSGGHICTDYAGCSSGHPLRWCVHQSGHGPGPVDGNSDLYNSCATPPKSCSASCPCTWTPDDVWSWLTSF